MVRSFTRCYNFLTFTGQESISGSLQNEVAAALSGTVPFTPSYQPNRSVFNFDQGLDWVSLTILRRTMTDIYLGIL
jgi:hypothetical protein